ncbi:MAG: hypothetical protein GY737_26900, partial [Desulfobacteraceae bacterium]|nr:hypothetical protein [Desulfobacteraceae bacterium]
KKNGEQRMCVDYRELNRRTMKEDWPTPRIDDSISRLATQRYLSCFDLRGGYLHIPVLETSRKYTRFTTPYGAYQAKRMLFGLVNAPAHFQETMERIFAEVRKMEGVVLEIYIDDLVLGTVTEERHLQALRRLFTVALREGLKFERRKSGLGVEQVNYLGHVVSYGKRGPDEKYRQKLLDLRRPTDKKGVMRLLGMFEWCSRFVPHYADRVSLLRPLTHKDKPFEWTDRHQKQLDALKGVIRDVPYLFEPNGDGKFVLECDASDYAVGATLYQWQTPEVIREEKSADNAPADVLRPLDHFSRTFRGSEKNWCIAEKELFAVKVSIENWDHWLYGHQFEVLTDHKNLVYLFNDPTRDAGNRRWARWAVSLQQYSFTVSYVKGEENK